MLTVEGGVHAPHVNQQAHHGHVDSSRSFCKQFVFQDFAALAALRHSIQVYVCKCMTARFV